MLSKYRLTELEIFLNIFNSHLQNVTFLGLVTWDELKIVTEQNKNTQTKQNKPLLNKVWSPSNDQVTSPKNKGKHKLLK